jgi:arginase
MKQFGSKVLIIQNARGNPYSGVILSKPLIHSIFPPLKYNTEIIPKTEFKNCIKGTNTVFQKTLECLETQPHTLSIGGDHYTSFGTILASLKKYKNQFSLLWLDAHTDIHSFESSPSKNMHGMVVRMLMTHNYTNIPRLIPNQILYVGVRNIDSPELKFIKANKIKMISLQDFHEKHMESYKMIQMFVKNKPVHISLDVDVLDPILMPSTGTPEENGMKLTELLRLIDQVRQTASNHYATDIMEYNPKIGTIEERHQAYQVFYKLVHHIV